MKSKDGARAPPTTRNIPELGISCSIPLTEYYTNLSSTLYWTPNLISVKFRANAPSQYTQLTMSFRALNTDFEEVIIIDLLPEEERREYCVSEGLKSHLADLG